MIPKVSIIVTIYNREKYIETCACSLFEQTLDNIEYIFVNDASVDHSLDILNVVIDKYHNRKPMTKVINLKNNGGVSNARRIGMEQVSGEFVIHTDSDGWVDADMLERLYMKAKETDADIVGCNLCHEYPHQTYIFRQQYADTINENIANLILGKIHPSLCTSLTNTKLITNNNIFFPEGLNMGEDLYYNLQLYLHAHKIVGMDFAPYHYRHTTDSSSFHHTRQTIDSGIIIGKKIELLMKSMDRYNEFASEIEFRKFSLKLSLVNNFDNKDNYKYWLTIFPETHRFIWKYNQLNWKLRLELWFAAHHMYIISKVIKKTLAWQHLVRLS